jgi:hypothetical protein
MDRFDHGWKRDRRHVLAVRFAALVCLAISFAAIAIKTVPLG